MAIKLNDIMVKVKGLMDLEDSDKNLQNLNEMHDSIQQVRERYTDYQH